MTFGGRELPYGDKHFKGLMTDIQVKYLRVGQLLSVCTCTCRCSLEPCPPPRLSPTLPASRKASTSSVPALTNPPPDSRGRCRLLGRGDRMGDCGQCHHITAKVWCSSDLGDCCFTGRQMCAPSPCPWLTGGCCCQPVCPGRGAGTSAGGAALTAIVLETSWKHSPGLGVGYSWTGALRM